MRRRLTFVKLVVWCACLAPAAWLVLRGMEVHGLTLGADPVKEILNVCGKTGLNLLVLTLCITPIRRSTGWNQLIRLRRLLGLFAFFYLVLHFLDYLALYVQFDWKTIAGDITKRPYITLGFTALVLLIPLAVTSTSGWQRRLGRRWTKLHMLIYPIAVLAVVHYYWQTKLDVSEPLLYAFLVAVLFTARLIHWWDLRNRRQRSVDAKATMAPTYQRVQPP